MGSICSAIGRAINGVISAIASVIMAIALRASSSPSGTSSLTLSAAAAGHVVVRAEQGEQEDTSRSRLKSLSYDI
ncbi:hypothetical protein FRC06_003495 [Ceratobasidium sp. 370]|nr:hypothetical protein FRC06_003495 [Ceratobasidium sp. 370]